MAVNNNTKTDADVKEYDTSGSSSSEDTVDDTSGSSSKEETVSVTVKKGFKAQAKKGGSKGIYQRALENASPEKLRAIFMADFNGTKKAYLEPLIEKQQRRIQRAQKKWLMLKKADKMEAARVAIVLELAKNEGVMDCDEYELGSKEGAAHRFICDQEHNWGDDLHENGHPCLVELKKAEDLLSVFESLHRSC